MKIYIAFTIFLVILLAVYWKITEPHKPYLTPVPVMTTKCPAGMSKVENICIKIPLKPGEFES